VGRVRDCPAKEQIDQMVSVDLLGDANTFGNAYNEKQELKRITNPMDHQGFVSVAFSDGDEPETSVYIS